MVKITNQSGEEAWYEGEDNISTDNLQKKRPRENPWKIWKTNITWLVSTCSSISVITVLANVTFQSGKKRDCSAVLNFRQPLFQSNDNCSNVKLSSSFVPTKTVPMYSSQSRLSDDNCSSVTFSSGRLVVGSKRRIKGRGWEGKSLSISLDSLNFKTVNFLNV